MSSGKFFYTVLIETVENEENSYLQVFWAWADHIGQAVAKTTAAARETGMPAPIAVQIDPFDHDTLPDHAEPAGKTGVLMADTRYYFPTRPTFLLPKGVIFSCGESDFDPEDMQPGYTRHRKEDLHRLEVLVPADRLAEVFLILTAALPSIRVCWVELVEEWERAGVTQLYANEDLSTPEAVRTFLESEKLNILDNGKVKFTAYAEDGATNLVLNDHKEICLISHAPEIVDTMAGILQAEGLEEMEAENFKSLGSGCYHWHYKPEGALSRNDLAEHLEMRGFFLWKEIPAEPD